MQIVKLVVCVEKLHWCCRHVRQRFNPINVQACASFRFTSVVRGAVWKKRIFIFFDLFQANAKIVNLFIISSSPGLNALRRQAHLLNATCYFVSSPAAFEAKKKEQLLSCIFTSSDSQDSGKSIFLNCFVPLKHNIKSIEEGVMLTDEQAIDRRFLI
ncbi:hypothetical protein T02_7184 [Trichinella nativa]|uniref:Uncharacterized protein n=1 Tax=Trichinella nativa TaxID=6335 RepID=A0A0V1LLD3_9BILA|nr:hypothetical protein T02_7184 [Trichinella nativa]